MRHQEDHKLVNKDSIEKLYNVLSGTSESRETASSR